MCGVFIFVSLYGVESDMEPEQHSGSGHAPLAPYNSIKNPNFNAANSIEFPFFPPSSTPVPNYVALISPNMNFNLSASDNRFTTYPNYPLNRGSNASEISRLAEARSLFNHVNTANHVIAYGSGALQGRPYVTFKSDQDRIKYIQATHSLRYGFNQAVSDSRTGIQP